MIAIYSGIYKIADVNLEISSVCTDIHEMCTPYKSTGAITCRIVTTQEDIEQERLHSLCRDRREGRPQYQFPDGYLETLAVYRKMTDQFLDRHILLFHGSVIAVDGIGYLFTATSGTGKSTHTRLWREHFGDRAVMVNDDKPLLKFTENGAYACGTPWNGKHHIGNNMIVPLKAICILERGEADDIVSLTPKEALPMLLQQSHRPSSGADYPKYLSLIERIGKQVELYRMHCTISQEAVRIAYETMSGKDY